MNSIYMNKRRKITAGFSLIELVIVVVIIAIIGAIAIPRMSRGAAGAADSALIGNLKVLRSAIDLYANEHGGAFPSATNATFISQLTTYTDDTGATSTTKDTTHIYGPYLRSIPTLPVGTAKGQSAIGAAAGTGIGWIYDSTAGTIKAATTTEADVKGIAYNTY